MTDQRQDSDRVVVRIMQAVTVDTRLRKCLITKRLGTSQTQRVRHVCLHAFTYTNLVDTVALVYRLVDLLVHAGFADLYAMPRKRFASSLDTAFRLNLQKGRELVHYRRAYQRVVRVRGSRGHNGVIPYRVIDYAYLVNEYGIAHTEFVLHRSIVMDTRVCIHYCCSYQQHAA